MGTRTYSRRGVLTRLGRERAERQGAPAGVAAQRPSGAELKREMSGYRIRDLVNVGEEAEKANDFDRAYAAYSEMANKRLTTFPDADGYGEAVIYDEQTPSDAVRNVGKALYQAFEKFKALDLNGVPMKEASELTKLFAIKLANTIAIAQSDIITANRRADRGEDTDQIYRIIASNLRDVTKDIGDLSNEKNSQILNELNNIFSEASDYFQAGADNGFINLED